MAKKEKGRELFFQVCPYCHGGASKDKDTFSINLDHGAFQCFRSSCGKRGHFVEMARDFSFPLDFGEVKQYKALPQKPIEVRENALAYLAKRGIGAEVAKKYDMTNRTDNPDILVFPFQDEHNIRQFIKYRNMNYQGKGNKEWCEAGAKPILFGMAQCADFTTLVITEGQIDSLSLAQCGVKNAVSVPTGARGFTWVQHCKEWMDRFEEIVVFGDYEHGRVSLVEELEKRCNKRMRVVRSQDYLGEKDANAILMKYGAEAVRQAVLQAQLPLIANVKDLALVESVDLNALPKITTGIHEVDRLLGGLYLGQLVLLSGERGQGKSTFASQLMANALEQGQGIFVYSGELPDFHFKGWLDLQLAGTSYLEESFNKFGDKIYHLPQHIVRQMSAWYQGRAFVYDNNFLPPDTGELTGILETIEQTIQRYDTKFICIDNLMTAMDFVSDQGSLYLAQSNFVGALKKLAVRYQVVILLIAHPRKMGKDGFQNDAVSGASDITNKADVVMAYGRDEAGPYDSRLTISKNRLTGKLATGDNAIGLNYSASTKRITGVWDQDKVYGWEREMETGMGTGFHVTQEVLDCPF